MNFKKLENNLLDMIQEQQVKIGYMSGVTRFYYPLQSLPREWRGTKSVISIVPNIR